MVSAACASSAKVFGNAARMIDAGLIDAAVVGGVDSLCLTTLYGFDSLELVSRRALPALRCRPRRHLDRRGGRFALVEAARRGSGPGGAVLSPESASRATRTTCRRRIRRAPARASRSKRRLQAPAWRRTTSTTSTCTAPARRAMTPPKTVPCTACSAIARQLPRPRAPPATRSAPPASSRRSSRRWRSAKASRRRAQHGHADPALQSAELPARATCRCAFDIALSNSFGFGGANCSLVIGRADRLPTVRAVH